MKTFKVIYRPTGELILDAAWRRRVPGADAPRPGRPDCGLCAHPNGPSPPQAAPAAQPKSAAKKAPRGIPQAPVEGETR